MICKECPWFLPFVFCDGAKGVCRNSGGVINADNGCGRYEYFSERRTQSDRDNDIIYKACWEIDRLFEEAME